MSLSQSENIFSPWKNQDSGSYGNSSREIDLLGPAQKQAKALLESYDFLNSELFSAALPAIMLTHSKTSSITASGPGGKQTGQRMSDYATPGGVFLKTLDKMPLSFKLPFTSIESDYAASNDMFVHMPSGGHSTRQKRKKNRLKYSCDKCSTNLWGKPGLQIKCAPCGTFFNEKIDIIK